ncbi:MAG TPA: hypothetical protein G4O16_05620 [Dehalococcoidia bacterium]|nr:hypothetical protein [Dehalococcoidia bacterium]
MAQRIYRLDSVNEVPSPLNPPPGCSFHPRCVMAIPECSQAVPPLREIGGEHQVACIRV